MNKFAKKLKKKLDQSIKKLVWNRDDYVRDPKEISLEIEKSL